MPEKKLSVFLVDDEKIIRTGMKKLYNWEESGFVIAGEAENGRDALPLIESLSPDLVITDLKMPFCDGITLAEKIKEILPLTKVIILTGYDEFDYAKQAIRAGVFDFLLKPISPKELDETLARLKQELKERNIPYPFEKEKALIDAIKNADCVKSLGILDDIFENFKMNKTDRTTAFNICSKLSYEIVRACKEHLSAFSVPRPQFEAESGSGVIRSALSDYIKEAFGEYENHNSSKLVQRIIQYLEENYDQNITLSALEKEFFFNASYISRVFKLKTGKNYSDYLLDIRIEHAKELLTGTNRSISYISDTVGFGNSKYFSRIFKEKTGMQPIAYRKFGDKNQC